MIYARHERRRRDPARSADAALPISPPAPLGRACLARPPLQARSGRRRASARRTFRSRSSRTARTRSPCAWRACAMRPTRRSPPPTGRSRSPRARARSRSARFVFVGSVESVVTASCFIDEPHSVERRFALREVRFVRRTVRRARRSVACTSLQPNNRTQRATGLRLARGRRARRRRRRGGGRCRRGGAPVGAHADVALRVVRIN